MDAGLIFRCYSLYYK